MSRRAPIEKDLTKAKLKKFVYPAKAVADVTELKELLDCCFFQYGGEGDDDGDADDDEQQWKNFSAYCRRVGGFAWLNALHAFWGAGEDDDGKVVRLDTPLTYVISTSPDEWRFPPSVGRGRQRA